MNTLENLQYAVVGKFSYGWPDIEELQLRIPIQCDVKGECKIGLLRHKHILMRFSRQDDFINMMSKSSYYILSKDGYSYMMRPLIYDAKFSVEEETTEAMAWISFLDLKPTFFVKESIFSMASAVDLPKFIELEGHDENVCRVLHPELRKSELQSENNEVIAITEGVGEVTRKRDLDIAPAISQTCKKSSPISTLHNLVSHQTTEGDFQAISKNYGVEDIKDSEEKNNTSNEDQIMKTVGINAKSSSKGIKDTDQQLTLQLHFQDTGDIILATMVYAKCDALERINLWDDIYNIGVNYNMPWVALLHGGMAELMGSVFLRDWIELWSNNLLSISQFICEEAIQIPEVLGGKRRFSGTVIDSWKSMDSTDMFINLKQKMKNTKTALSRWSRENFGDIFKKLAIREEIVKLKEALFEEHPTTPNRMIFQQSQAELQKYIHYEEEYWRQKASFQWYIEGDKNTRFFNCLVNGRRKRLSVSRMLQEDGQWTEGNDRVVEEAINFFKGQFVVEDSAEELTLLMHVP
ncbi:hypothetical protein KY284_006579 [Solanum tuberosum]|nr:hypothetical protein KY284_024882 [Solanum tuberosum]KAH0721549.1 hypothetical protein KY284_006579 [Solanum tuberosum]